VKVRSAGRVMRSVVATAFLFGVACTAHTSAGTSVAATPTPRGVIVFDDDPLTGPTHRQLYIENADGSDVRPLVTSTADDVGASISPDGTQVVFTRERDGRPDRMFVVNIDGSDLHPLIPTGCPGTCGEASEGHAWSSDGSRIVFTRELFDRGPVPFAVQVWIANADGSDARQLTDPHHAQDDDAGWSPDGSRIVFVHWAYGHPDRYRIEVIGTDGSGLRPITPARLAAWAPAWSPDGTTIVFQAPPDPQGIGGTPQQLYAVAPDGSGLHELTAGLGGYASNAVAWSPDGAELVFAHAPSGPLGSDLFVMRPDGSDAHALAETPLNETDPDWGSAPAS